MQDSSYNVLRTLRADNNKTLGLLQEMRRRFHLWVFAVWDPQSHPDFEQAMNDLDPFAGHQSGIFVFAPVDPPPSWFNADFRRLELSDSIRVATNLTPDVAIVSKSTKSRSITASSFATDLNIRHRELPCLIATPDLASQHVTILPTHSRTVNEQISALSQVARRHRDTLWIRGDLHGPLRQVELSGRHRNAILGEPVARMVSHQQSLVLATDEGHPHHRDAHSDAKARCLNAQEAQRRLRWQLASLHDLKERLDDADQQDQLRYSTDAMARDIEILCDTVFWALAQLSPSLARPTCSTWTFPKLDRSLLEEESRRIVESAQLAYDTLQSGLISRPDFHPIVVALSRVFEAEVNLSIVHWIRDVLGIEMPDYFDRFRPPRRESDKFVFDTVRFNASWERADDPNIWAPPSIGQVHRVCETLDGKPSRGLSDDEKSKLKKYQIPWERMKEPIPWKTLKTGWRDIAVRRNYAAHDFKAGEEQDVIEVRNTIDSLAAVDVFRHLYDLKVRFSGGNIFSDIASVANLDFKEVVTIRHDPRTRQEDVQVLYDSWLCHAEEAKRHIRGLQDRRGFPDDMSIVDILGEYIPDKKEVVIYDEMCRIAAEAMKVQTSTRRKEKPRVEALMQVVLAHEVAHAVTHLGKDEKGEIWDQFSRADAQDKEQFAQAYSLIFFKADGKEQYERIFRELANHQSKKYNSWEQYDAKSIEQAIVDVNADLRKARDRTDVVADNWVRVSINERLERPANDPVKAGDLAGLHGRLHLPGRDIHPHLCCRRSLKLTGLEHARSLDGLSSNCAVADLHPLSQLANLRWLHLLGDLRRDLEPLPNFADLTPLSGLKDLEYLALSSHQMMDLQPISGLNKLVKLYVRGRLVEDLTPLSSLTKLRDLGLSSPRMTDLRPVSRLKELTTLGVFGELVEDLIPLSGLTKLKTLRLWSLRMTDLGPISRMTQLTGLSLSGPLVTDPTPILDLVNLKRLHIHIGSVHGDSQLEQFLSKLKKRGVYIY